MVTRKWLTEPDDYVCLLSEETQRIAKIELREDQHVRNQALASMRHWIMKNPRFINCRLDASFLLRFLRSRKFSVLQAQESLERLLLFRQIYKPASGKLDMSKPPMEELIDKAVLFPVARRDKLGRKIVFLNLSLFDITRYTKDDLIHLFIMSYFVGLEDEESQVRGFVYVFDFQGVGIEFTTIFPPKEIVHLIKFALRTAPSRHKALHLVNIHPSLMYICNFLISFLSDKLRLRVKFYASWDDYLNGGSIEPDLLPKEYGGTTSISEMVASWKEEIKQNHDKLQLYDHMSVNVDLYSARERVATSFDHIDDVDSLYGVSGNFRKLEID